MNQSHVPGHTTATVSREKRDYTAPTRVHRRPQAPGLVSTK